jgi:hypothetical protein
VISIYSEAKNSDKSDGMDFDKVSIFVNRRNVFRYSLVAAVLFGAYLLVLYLFWKEMGWGLSAFVALGSIIMGCSMFYGIRLYIEIEPIFHLEPAGVFDGASMFELGAIQTRDIEMLSLTNYGGVFFVVIHLNSHTFLDSTVYNNSDILFRLYSKLWSRKVWFPVIFLNVPFYQLATIVRNFNSYLSTGEKLKVVDEVEPTQKAKRFEERVAEAEENLATTRPIPITRSKKTWTEKVTTSRPPIQAGNTAPQIVVNERDKVLAEIEAIKQEVHASGLDTLLIELYWDHARYFGDWEQVKDERLPAQVQDIRVQRLPGEESTVFHYLGHEFKFLYKLDKAKGTEGIFVVYVDSEIKAFFTVEPEIGTMAAKDLKTFITGAWVDLLLKLSHRLEQGALNQVTSPETLLPEEDEVTQTTQLEDLEELKRKFGLDS